MILQLVLVSAVLWQCHLRTPRDTVDSINIDHTMISHDLMWDTIQTALVLP